MATLTLDVPDDLRDAGEAFVKALQALLPESLRAYFEDVEDDAWCTRLAREAEARIASGEEDLIDWERVKAPAQRTRY